MYLEEEGQSQSRGWLHYYYITGCDAIYTNYVLYMHWITGCQPAANPKYVLRHPKKYKHGHNCTYQWTCFYDRSKGLDTWAYAEMEKRWSCRGCLFFKAVHFFFFCTVFIIGFSLFFGIFASFAQLSIHFHIFCVLFFSQPTPIGGPWASHWLNKGGTRRDEEGWGPLASSPDQGQLATLLWQTEALLH